MKELIANLVWDDDRNALRLDRFIDVDSGLEGYGLEEEFERLVSQRDDFGHDGFCQGSLRFEMLRTRK